MYVYVYVVGVGWRLEEFTQSSHPKVVSAYQFRTKKKVVIRMYPHFYSNGNYIYLEAILANSECHG